MSSEMRELIRKEVEQWVGITRNRDIERSARVWMEGYDAALTYCAERISAILAHTSEARDAARLDWLESNGCDHLWRKSDNAPAERWYDSRTSVEAGSDRFPTLRAAIDAAMRQEGGNG